MVAMRVLSLLAVIVAAALASAPVLQYVDPLIGTGGEWFGCAAVIPGAQMPFSNVRLSPDTESSMSPWLPFQHFGGYHYPDDTIRVFSHLHTQGAGELDLGIVAVLPFPRVPRAADVINYGYKSRFAHANESATPGLYSVLLQTHNVQAQLTAGTMVGAHRYAWLDRDAQRVILFPISHAMPQEGCKQTNITVDVRAQEVSGFIQHMGSFGRKNGRGVTAYFVARFNATFGSFGTWKGDKISPGSAQSSSCWAGAYAEFNSSTVEMFIGVSYISVDQARRNLVAEMGPRPSFDAQVAAAQDAWQELLGRVQVEGGDADERTKFYTSLYHSLCAPSTYSEADGLYVGFDAKVHQIVPPMKRYYSDMSMWDVYRDQMPLLSLFVPDIMGDIAQSIVLIAQQGGYLPQWPFFNLYTCTMVGQHAVNIIADAYIRGVRNFDANAAMTIMINASNVPQAVCGRNRLEQYDSLGYIAYTQGSDHATQLTFTYAHNDFALAAMARAMNRTADYQFFYNRSQNYRNVWDAKENFYCGRYANGSFVCPDNKLKFGNDFFIEGSAWQYRFYGEDPVSLFGSANAFVAALDEALMRARLWRTNWLPNPYYWQGNEPAILGPWEFSFANRTDLTCKHTRWLMENEYSSAPNGIPGNDDYGAISSWYTWAALGLYPQYSGTDRYAIGSPSFSRVTMRRQGYGTVTLLANGASRNAIYVKSVTVNGVAHTLPTLLHADLALPNATIEFVMGESP